MPIGHLLSNYSTARAVDNKCHMIPHETAIIQSFFLPNRRPRWLDSLSSSKRRGKILDRLNHCQDLDDRSTKVLSSGVNIVEFLKARGAPATCYLMSAAEQLDGKELPLEEAVRATMAGGWGTTISCVPGRLAFYYDECGERMILLERSPA